MPKQSQSRDETEIQRREERPAAFRKKHKEGHKTKLSRKETALLQESRAVSFRPSGLAICDWRVGKRLAHKRKRTTAKNGARIVMDKRSLWQRKALKGSRLRLLIRGVLAAFLVVVFISLAVAPDGPRHQGG